MTYLTRKRKAETVARAMTVRADELQLRDKVVIPWWDESTRIGTIHKLAMIGDDVEFYCDEFVGEISQSQSTPMAIIRRVAR